MEAQGLQLVSPPSTPIPDTLASFPGIHPGLHMAVQPIHHILHIPGQGRCRKRLGPSHRTQERCPSQASRGSEALCLEPTHIYCYHILSVCTFPSFTIYTLENLFLSRKKKQHLSTIFHSNNLPIPRDPPSS